MKDDFPFLIVNASFHWVFLISFRSQFDIHFSSF